MGLPYSVYHSLMQKKFKHFKNLDGYFCVEYSEEYRTFQQQMVAIVSFQKFFIRFKLIETKEVFHEKVVFYSDLPAFSPFLIPQ